MSTDRPQLSISVHMYRYALHIIVILSLHTAGFSSCDSCNCGIALLPLQLSTWKQHHHDISVEMYRFCFLHKSLWAIMTIHFSLHGVLVIRIFHRMTACGQALISIRTYGAINGPRLRSNEPLRHTHYMPPLGQELPG